MNYHRPKEPREEILKRMQDALDNSMGIFKSTVQGWGIFESWKYRMQDALDHSMGIFKSIVQG